MADYTFTYSGHRYVDYTTGTDSTTGTNGQKMSTPWKTLNYALTNAPASAAIWVRRGTSEAVGATINQSAPVSQISKPRVLSSWPRPVLSGYVTVTSGFPNFVISGGGMTELGYVARPFTDSAGNRYIVGKVLNANSGIMDPSWAIAGGTNLPITFTADRMYDVANALVSGNGADLKSTWDSDNKNIYALSFTGAYEWLSNNVIYFDRYNIAVTGTVGATYMVRDNSGKKNIWGGCYFKNTLDDAWLHYTYAQVTHYYDCIFEGINSLDNDQYAIYAEGSIIAKNCVIVSVGNRAIYGNACGLVYLENIKAPLDGYYAQYGVDLTTSPTAYDAPHIINNCVFSGAVNPDYRFTAASTDVLQVRNHRRVPGDHRMWINGLGEVRKSTTYTVPGTDFSLRCDWLNGESNWGFRAREGQGSHDLRGRAILTQKLSLPGSSGELYDLGFNYFNMNSSGLTSNDVYVEVERSSASDIFDYGVGGSIYKSATNSFTYSGWTEVLATDVPGGNLTLRAYFAGPNIDKTKYMYISPYPIVRRS